MHDEVAEEEVAAVGSRVKHKIQCTCMRLIYILNMNLIKLLRIQILLIYGLQIKLNGKAVFFSFFLIFKIFIKFYFI